jgi:hypothetical protein
MKIGRYLINPSPETVQQAADVGIGKDASVYLHGLVLFPLFVAVVIMGQLDTLIAASSTESNIVLWNTVPEWFWTTALILTRLLNVCLVVCSVYMVYRIGTVLADRQAGKIAALFTSLSLAVIHTAHEVNEDTPAMFLLLVVLYLSIRYVQTDNSQFFLIGCALGGLAIAFKLTAGIAVIFLGFAYLLTALEKSDPISAFYQPKILFYGCLLGISFIYVGIPNLLLRGPEWFIGVRLSGQTVEKTTIGSTPQGYSALLAYLNGLGLPLLIATASGAVSNIYRYIRNKEWKCEEFILLLGIIAYLLVFFVFWSNFKTHHVLPSIPLLMISLGIAFSKHIHDRTNLARIALVGILLTTVLYSGFGLVQFTDDPRDEATEWLKTEADTDEVMTIFGNSPPQAGLVHGQSIDHFQFGQTYDPGDPYTEWVISTPDRKPEYIQTTTSIRNENQFPRRSEFNTRLIDGDRFDYSVAAEFGERSKAQSSYEKILYAGIKPKIEKRYDYVLILKHNY